MTIKGHVFSSRSFHCAMAGSLSLGPHSHTDLLLHGPPACLSSHPLARSLCGIPRGSWLLYLAACFASGSQHLCLPPPLCRYLFTPHLLPLFTLALWKERKPLNLNGEMWFFWVVGSSWPRLIGTHATRVVGDQCGLVPGSSTDSSPALPPRQ